jgi:hypothetical protein
MNGAERHRLRAMGERVDHKPDAGLGVFVAVDEFFRVVRAAFLAADDLEPDSLKGPCALPPVVWGGHVFGWECSPKK